MLSVESSIRVPIGSTLKIAAVEFAGTALWALAHVSCVLVRTSISSGTRSSALRRVAAVRRERVQRAVQPPRLLGRELGRAREVDRAHAATPLRSGLVLGQPALASRVDERRDRIRGEDRTAALTHAAASEAMAGTRSCSTPPASRTVMRRVPTWTRIVRPRLPPVSEAIDADMRGVELVAHGGLVALADFEGGGGHGEHRSTPDKDGVQIRTARTGGDDAIDELGDGMIGELVRARLGVPAAGGQHDVRQPRHALTAIDQRQADARAQTEGHQNIAGDGRGGELTHPDHRLRHCYRPNRPSSCSTPP